MFYKKNGDVVWENEDLQEYPLVGGPYNGQCRFHTPDVATEGGGFDEPFPFEPAKWEANPDRLTLCAKYRWNAELGAFEYKGSFEWKLSGFATLQLGGEDGPKLTESRPL